MSEILGVNIAQNSREFSEYIIRDKNKIVIGRFNVVELDKEDNKTSIKLKFYRQDDRELLKESLKVMLNGLYKDIHMNKINVYIMETMNLEAFLDIGFTLEGILTENIKWQGNSYSELIMGITRQDYNNFCRIDYTEITSENLKMRILTPEDAKELLEYNIRNKRHLERYEPRRDNCFYTLEVQKKILEDSYRQYLNGSSLDFGIFKDNKFIGKIKVSNIVYGIFKNGIIGYSIDKDEQGKGYMKEAVNRIVKYCFDELGLHRVEASALLENERSKGVLEGCGFLKLGINKNYLFINGKWRDHITYYKVKN